jgi:hypothetical protein
MTRSNAPAALDFFGNDVLNEEEKVMENLF